MKMKDSEAKEVAQKMADGIVVAVGALKTKESDDPIATFMAGVYLLCLTRNRSKLKDLTELEFWDSSKEVYRIYSKMAFDMNKGVLKDANE